MLSCSSSSSGALRLAMKVPPRPFSEEEEREKRKQEDRLDELSSSSSPRFSPPPSLSLSLSPCLPSLCSSHRVKRSKCLMMNIRIVDSQWSEHISDFHPFRYFASSRSFQNDCMHRHASTIWAAAFLFSPPSEDQA